MRVTGVNRVLCLSLLRHSCKSWDDVAWPILEEHAVGIAAGKSVEPARLRWNGDVAWL